MQRVLRRFTPVIVRRVGRRVLRRPPVQPARPRPEPAVEPAPPPEPALNPQPTAAPEPDPSPPSSSLWNVLQPYLPNDHARQVSSRYYIEGLMGGPEKPQKVLDLGCGRGDSVDLFRRFHPDVDWTGVDIGDSQEALQRQRADAHFVTYDGRTIPFPADTFDLVYSSQVLEHVREPAQHLTEIRRVLRPGGVLIGSTSQLEPYHSRSYWNFTAFGFVTLAEEAGLKVEELRPGIDGVSLTLRTFLGRDPMFDRWWDTDSPVHTLIDEWGRETGRRPALVNLRKMHLAGQFAFRVRKP